MDQQSITVCVTGAAGQIAYSFVPLLLNGLVFRSSRIHLKLLDIPMMEQVLKGFEMEILDGAYPLLQSIETGSDPRILFKNVDVIVFLGGFPRKPGMERKDLLQMNGSIFKEQAAALNEVAPPHVRGLVVANPANTNCHILATHATKFPRSHFTCLTRLDENRAYAQIANRLKVPLSSIDGVAIWGNHSTTQYPCTQFSTVNGQPLEEDEYWQTSFITKVQKRGGEILEARKNSSVCSAANAVKDHLRDWYFGTQDQIHSMGVSSDGSYNIPVNLVFSLPVTLKGNWEYAIKFIYILTILNRQGLELSSFSVDKLKVTTQELVEEEEEAGLKSAQQ